ncbi:gametogenetin-like [Theropithecus gelada]|uniref:gametogenetin-like n=1 Tax=Theropithecus gelada TaxID=9565 RepID=UPI000DC1AE4C|nr:gametogenetin-like [Theropithecus gelada]
MLPLKRLLDWGLLIQGTVVTSGGNPGNLEKPERVGPAPISLPRTRNLPGRSRAWARLPFVSPTSRCSSGPLGRALPSSPAHPTVGLGVSSAPPPSPPSASRSPCLLAALQCRPPGGVPPQAPALGTQALSALSVAAAAGGPGTAGWELPRSVPQAPGRREPARLARSRSTRSEGPLTAAEPARGQSPRQTANREAAGTWGGRGGRIAGVQEFETRLGNILPPACEMRLMDSCSCGSDGARPPQHSAQGSQEE